jgi:hypothetical protein
MEEGLVRRKMLAGDDEAEGYKVVTSSTLPGVEELRGI